MKNNLDTIVRVPIEGNSTERMEHAGKNSIETNNLGMDTKTELSPTGATSEFQSDPLPMKSDMSPLQVFDGMFEY